jgi:hypothetical protein
VPLAALAAAVVVGLFAAWLLKKATGSYGVNFTPDSLNYLSASRSLLQGKGFLDNDGRPFLFWPPLYPLVLAGGRALGFGVLQWARLVNAGLLVVLSVSFTSLAWRVSRSIPLALAGAAFVTCNASLFLNFGHVYSEPLFITLLVVSAALLAEYWDRRTWPWLVAAAAAAALACVQRYIGVVMLGAGTLAVFAFGRSWRQRFSTAAIFGAIGVAPLGLWMTRNLLITGSPGGNRAPAARGVTENYKLLVQSMISPFVTPRTVSVTLENLLFIALVVTVAIFAWRWRRIAAWETSRQGGLALSALFAVGYSAFLLYVASTSGTDVNERILSPTLPFLTLIGLTAASVIVPEDPPERRGAVWWVVNVAVIVAMLWFIRVPIEYTRDLAAKWRWQGVPTGYATSKRAKQAGIRWLLANADGRVIYTNRPDYALELATKGRLTSTRLRRQANGETALPASAATTDSLFVYFPEDSRNSPLTTAGVSSGLTLVPVFTSPEAQIYRIEPPAK